MEIDEREEEQRDWTGYGSAERPVVVTYSRILTRDSSAHAPGSMA
jgi:hypothetical protein